MKPVYSGLLVAACLGCTAYINAAAQKAPLSSIPTVPATAIQLRFVNTDVSDVLQAISVQAHANIVFPAQLKKLISINLAADSTKAALSYVAAAGGLAFRYANGTYVVAVPAELRQALEPFGEQTTVTLKALTADQAVKLIEGAFPYLTARPAGSRLLVIGATEDIQNALRLLQDQDTPQALDPFVSEVETVQYSSASQLAKMIAALYPTLKAEAIGLTDQKGGAVGLAGPKSQVDGAKQALLRADLPLSGQSPGIEYRVYQIKYSSASILQTFIKNASPDVTAIVGPDSYSPQEPVYNPILGQQLGTGGSSGGSSGSSGTSGASGGSTGSSGGSSTGAGGSSASSGVSGAPGATGASGQSMNSLRAKTLILRGMGDDVDKAMKLLEQVDTPPKQVMIEVKVIDTTPAEAEQLGLLFQYSPLGELNVPSGSNVGATPFSSTPFGTTTNNTNGTFSRLPVGATAQLNALTTVTESKLLANPRVQVLDNDSASVFIGSTLNVELSQSSLSGQTLSVQQFPVGIILLVRPRVNADGKITMLVHPVVSIVTSINSDGLPQTSSREEETTVMVQDGETVVIGGLINDQMSKEIDSIPILSKIPIIGELFKNRNKSHSHDEVMVFITPHLLK